VGAPTAEPRRGVTALAIRRPVGVLAISAVVCVLGLFFLDRLPVDLLPTISYPRIIVTVNYPGAAPEVMEEQVTRVLEASLAATEGVISIESRASEGRTNVNLVFDYGIDIDLALQDAARNLELARTQLPPDIMPPRIYKVDPAQAPVYEAGFTSLTRSPLEVRDWLDSRLVPQLLTVRGVGGVEVAGGQVREIQVVVDLERLDAYGVSMAEVAALLAAENVDIAAGQVTSDSFDVMAKTDGRFRSVRDIEDVVVPLAAPGEFIRLAEVAEVRDTHREQRIFVRLDGQPATRLSVMKLPEANTVAVIEGVRASLERLRQSGFIPEDIDFRVTRDQSFFIESSIGAVSVAALFGGALAMVVVLLFLGSLRKAFVIGLSIPLAILATFAMMGASGLTLNIMSLGGIALGLGLLLDNAIVMLENITRHREELAKGAGDAALDGAKEVTSAVVASTLTNLAAVTPFLLITGLAAMVFRDLILTISFAIVASLGAALTLVPALAALLSGVRLSSGLSRSPPIRAVHWFVGLLTRAYLVVARRAFRWRWAVVALTIGLVVVAFDLLGDLGQEFLPEVDDGSVAVTMHLPPGAPPEVTDAYAREVEAVIDTMPHVDTVFALVGGHLGGGILNERPGTARYSVLLTAASARPELTAAAWVREMQGRLDALDIPGARLSARPPSIPGIRLGTTGSAISIGVVGEDLAVLDRVGRELLLELEGIPGLTGLELTRDDRSPLLQIEVDRARAADLGLSLREVGDAVRAAVGGAVPTRFSAGVTDYDVRLMLPRAQVRQADDLDGLILFRAGGRSVRLGDVARFELVDGPAHIERENQVRIVRLDADVQTAVSDVATVNRMIRERLAGYDLPPQYTLIYGGEEEVIRETNRSLLIVILLALFLVFTVLAVQYERLSSPLVILTSAPLALIGVVSLLWLTGTRLSAPVLIGVVLLIGIVVNNAILLVEYIERGRRDRGLDPMAAALEAGRIRLRPILMTTATTVCGMLPLAIGMGEGAEIMRPLALAVVGGLIFATFLTLFVVPSLYLITVPAAERLVAWLGAGRPDGGPPSDRGPSR